jgi:hypothetical protein
MTKLLESAFEKISHLSAVEQNMYAKFIIEEMESELEWSHAFSERLLDRVKK